MSAVLETLLAGERLDLPKRLGDGTRVGSPVPGALRFEPARTAAGSIVLSAGVHGNETAPIELLDRLCADVLDGAMRVRARLLVAFGNLPAMRAGERFLEHDLNRLFGPGRAAAAEAAEAQRAAELEAAVDAFLGRAPAAPLLHYDLHTAIRGSRVERFALYPYPADGAFRPGQIARFTRTGVETMLLQGGPSPTFSWYSRQRWNAEGFTVELGRARPFGHNHEVRLDDVDTALRAFVEGDLAAPPYDPDAVRLYRVAREIVKASEDFVLHLDDGVENFTPLEPGFLLAEDRDRSWVVTEAGARIIFPNPRVRPGQRAGLIIVPCALH